MKARVTLILALLACAAHCSSNEPSPEVAPGVVGGNAGAVGAGGSTAGGGGSTAGGGAGQSGSVGGSDAGSSDLIDPSRAMDWTKAGVTGGIPARATACATLDSTATAAQINAAIQSCPEGQAVVLDAGTYNLSAGIDWNGKSNVTLRGAGADKTLIAFGANASVGCRGAWANVCMDSGDTNWGGGPSNKADWTAGYATGTTELTLSSTTNLKVGSPIFLDQLNDDEPTTPDDGGIWVCTKVSANCNDDGPTGGPGGAARPGRDQVQIVTVTALSGNKVTISPGLYMPNWRTSQSPGAWWATKPVAGDGIESLSIDHTLSSEKSGIAIFNCSGCWVKGVRSIDSNRSHVWMYYSNRIVVRDSYFYGTKNAVSQSYGVECYPSSDSVIENNIFQRITAPEIMNAACSGSVVGYNYSINDFYTASAMWMMHSATMHAAGIDHVLIEGNVGAGLASDLFHGSHHFVTAFRNRWNGFEATKTDDTVAVRLWPRSRYYNIVANVLGDTAKPHSNYEVTPSVTGNWSASIYELGTGLVNITYEDPAVATTLLRWGNYDVVTGAPRWNAAEVPSGLSAFANPVPATHDVAPSLYLAAKPSFWGTMPWPPIGPDVTGGDLPNVGGHAFRIPAELCYADVMKGPADGSGNALSFSASACYP
jgi:hypothetical protein